PPRHRRGRGSEIACWHIVCTHAHSAYELVSASGFKKGPAPLLELPPGSRAMNQVTTRTRTAPIVESPRIGLTDETLVADPRAGLTPFQMVERKLQSLTRSQSVPLSLLSPTDTRLSRRVHG